MLKGTKPSLIAMFIALSASFAWAGAPLKGVDVKLGKNPGGGMAARTVTDDKGNFSFGVVPRGSYSVIIKFVIKPSSSAKLAPSPISVVVHGAVGGDATGSVAAARKSGSVIYLDRAEAPSVKFESDGVHPITGTVELAQ